MVYPIPSITLAPLHKPDGSAEYSHNGFSIVGGVNGPIEVQRRDELPEEAAIDVVVRPVAGVGGIRERHLESIIESTLRHIVVVEAHPRTLIQVTLQVISTQEDSTLGVPHQAASNIQILPALLQTSILALLSTSIPLSMIFTSTLIAVDPFGKLIPDPSAKEVQLASSTHVVAYSSQGDLLVIESEGFFGIDILEEVLEKAKHVCRGAGVEGRENGDMNMDAGGQMSLEETMKITLQKKIAKEQRWRQNTGKI